MTHLNFPFEGRYYLEIRNVNPKQMIECELASKNWKKE